MAATCLVIGPSGTRNWCLGKASYHHEFNSLEARRLRLRKDLSFSCLQGNEGISHLCGCGESFSKGGVGYKQKFTGRVVRSMLTSKRSGLVVTGPIAAHTMQESECQKNIVVTQRKDAQLDTGDNFLPNEVIEADGDAEISMERVDRVHLQLVALGFILGGFLLASNSEATAAEGLPIHHLAGLLDEGFDVGEWIQESLFYLGQEANGVVKSQLATGNTFASVGVIFGAGLVTSFSPCTLSVLPLTIGYIGGYDSSKSRASVAFDSVAFALGLATTLAGLGIVASLAGKAYGQIGQGLPIAVSCVAILMGLNLLQVVPLQLPSFFSSYNPKESAAGLPSGAQAYLAGLTFALAASPCSTPVLATLLSFVATTQDPVAGGGLLLAYTTGYVAPLLVAATFTGALKRLLSFRQYSNWINPTSGALLLGGGVYSLLTRVFPESSMMNNMIM